jgi:hypothetical protein
MRATLISVIILTLSFYSGRDLLTGRWESKPSVKGNITGIIFKSDSSFEGYVNKKIFVSGRYSYEEDILSFVDNGCDGKRATYRIVFFSHADSLRFEAISDSCAERKKGMSQLVVGRVK